MRGFAALHPVDTLEFRIRSDIPLSGGLGTSAAAIVAGLVAADSMYELDADLLGHATRLEGHPDNVAAALLGGFVLCADGRAERFDVPDGLEAVLVIPHEPVRTAAARAALPPEVPMADAVFNVAHAGLLVLGLTRGDWDLVARGLDDRLHQPRREHLYPRSMELVRRAPLARRDRRDDLRRRPDRPRLVPLRRDGRRPRDARRRSARAGRTSRALPFDDDRRRRRQALTKTGAPSGTCRISRRRSRSLARRQPVEAARPMLDGSLVPWMARRSPPAQPDGRSVWWPVSASAQQP